MSYSVRFTAGAREDIHRLYAFLVQHDVQAARHALKAIRKAMKLLEDFPFTCRKAEPQNPFFRELVIPFGATGYVVLFEIEDQSTVTVLAVRHQREDDYL